MHGLPSLLSTPRPIRLADYHHGPRSSLALNLEATGNTAHFEALCEPSAPTLPPTLFGCASSNSLRLVFERLGVQLRLAVAALPMSALGRAWPGPFYRACAACRVTSRDTTFVQRYIAQGSWIRHDVHGCQSSPTALLRIEPQHARHWGQAVSGRQSSCGSMLRRGVSPVPYWHCLRVCQMRKQALHALGWQQDGRAIQVGGEAGSVASPHVAVCLCVGLKRKLVRERW